MRGLIERDIENGRLAGDGEPGPLDELIGHWFTYRIAVGSRAGQKLFTLRTLPTSAVLEPEHQGHSRCAAHLRGVHGDELRAAPDACV